MKPRREIEIAYLASPFTHKDVEVMNHRTEQATKAAISLMRQGIFTWSPISYNGDWIHEGVAFDWTFWQVYDLEMISRLDSIIVLTIDGWDRSVGVKAEIEFALANGMAVKYVTMEQIESGDVDHLRNISDVQPTA